MRARCPNEGLHKWIFTQGRPPVGRQGERDEAGESEGSWHLSMAGGQPVVGVAGKATNSALYCHSRSPSISSRETLDNFLISVNPVDFVLLRLSHIQKVRQLHAKLRLRMVTYDLRLQLL